MSSPTIAQRGPFAVAVEAGKTYYWCTCGQSKAQPFCDGSHQGSSFTPKAYTAEQTGQAYFCGCKHAKSGVLCDGSHRALP